MSAIEPHAGELGRPLRTIEVQPLELPVPAETPEPDPEREFEPAEEPVEVPA